MGLSVVTLLWANRQPPTTIIHSFTPFSHTSLIQSNTHFNLHVVRVSPDDLFMKHSETCSFKNRVRTHSHSHTHSHTLTDKRVDTRTNSISRGHSSTPQPSQSTYQAQHQTSSTLRMVDNSLIIILVFTLVNKSTNKYQFVWEQDIFMRSQYQSYRAF